MALGMLGWRQNLPEFPGWRTALVKKWGICPGILKGTVRKREIGRHNDQGTAWAEPWKSREK